MDPPVQIWEALRVPTPGAPLTGGSCHQGHSTLMPLNLATNTDDGGSLCTETAGLGSVSSPWGPAIPPHTPAKQPGERSASLCKDTAAGRRLLRTTLCLSSQGGTSHPPSPPPHESPRSSLTHRSPSEGRFSSASSSRGAWKMRGSQLEPGARGLTAASRAGECLKMSENYQVTPRQNCFSSAGREGRKSPARLPASLQRLELPLPTPALRAASA